MPTHPLASPPRSLVCERRIPHDTPNLNEVPGKRLHRYFHINNWMRPHQSLRQPQADTDFQDRTPAMVLGLTDHIWTIEEILHTPVLTRLARSDPADLATGAALAA